MRLFQKKLIKKSNPLLLPLFTLLIGVLITPTFANVLEQVDTLYNTRDKLGNITQSLELIETTLKTATSDEMIYNLQWRYAQASSAAADYVDTSKENKLKIYSKGIDEGNKAISSHPNKIEGIYWQAIVLGRKAELKGILNSLGSIKPIRNSMKKILDINPEFHRAHFVLSRLYRKAPKVISIGNTKKALKHINKAVKLDPTETLYLLEKAYVLKKLKKKDEAKKILKTLLELPSNPKYFQDQVRKDKEEAQELLNKLN